MYVQNFYESALCYSVVGTGRYSITSVQVITLCEKYEVITVQRGSHLYATGI